MAAKKRSRSRPSRKRGKSSKKKMTYRDMVEKAIARLQEVQGSSLKAITNFIVNNFKVGKNAKVYVKLALKRGIKAGQFVRLNGKYRLNMMKKGKKPVKSARKVGKARRRRVKRSQKVSVKKLTKKRKTAKKSKGKKKTRKTKRSRKAAKKSKGKKTTRMTRRRRASARKAAAKIRKISQRRRRRRVSKR